MVAEADGVGVDARVSVGLAVSVGLGGVVGFAGGGVAAGVDVAGGLRSSPRTTPTAPSPRILPPIARRRRRDDKTPER